MMDKISFQGLTSFSVSPTAHQKVENLIRISYANINKESKCRINNHRPYSIKTAPESLTVVVKSENCGFFKYVPFKEDIEDIMIDLEKEVEGLMKKAHNNPLTAWIIGGTRVKSPQGTKVIETLNKVADIVCDKPGIDASVLVGSDTGEEVLIYRSGIKQLKLSLDKKINPKSDVQSELEKLFDIVDLNNTKLSYEA